jgi:hypothetical protein
LRTIHASASASHAAPDISATNNNGDLNVGMVSANVDNVFSDALHHMAIDAVSGVASKRFARNLQQNPRPAGGRGGHQAPMNT